MKFIHPRNKSILGGVTSVILRVTMVMCGLPLVSAAIMGGCQPKEYNFRGEVGVQ